MMNVSVHNGVMSKESKEKARRNVFKNKEISINENLIERGMSTRIKKGNKLRKGKVGAKKFIS